MSCCGYPDSITLEMLTVVLTGGMVHIALHAPQIQVSRDGWALNEDKTQDAATQATFLGATWATAKD